MVIQQDLLAGALQEFFNSNNEAKVIRDMFSRKDQDFKDPSEKDNYSASAIKPNYFTFPEFLMPSELANLTNYIFEKQSDFRHSQVINAHNDSGNIDYAHRRSKVLFNLGEFYPLFVDRLYSYLSLIFDKLNVTSFPVKKIEAQITATNDGEFFKMHNDNTHGALRSRKITYVYYFNQEPKAFTGGDLRLYYSRIENGRSIATKQFETVIPKQNLIVFFQSSIMHELVKVDCPSKAFKDSRFTLNGWIHR